MMWLLKEGYFEELVFNATSRSPFYIPEQEEIDELY